MARKAPATDTALVICAHGIHGQPGAALEHAERIRARGLFAEVHGCAHRGTPGLAETIRRVRARAICLAPLLMAEGFTLRRMLESLSHQERSRITVCQPVGTHPLLAEVMADMARAACATRSWAACDTALLVAGHGTVRHPDSGLSARRHAARLAASGVFREVAVAFLDERPGVGEVLERLARCIVVGLFIDRGEHGENDIPRLLAASGQDAVYTGPVGSDPRMTDLLLAQVQALSLAA